MQEFTEPHSIDREEHESRAIRTAGQLRQEPILYRLEPSPATEARRTDV
jgi:hypothetical protein